MFPGYEMQYDKHLLEVLLRKMWRKSIFFMTEHKKFVVFFLLFF